MSRMINFIDINGSPIVLVTSKIVGVAVGFKPGAKPEDKGETLILVDGLQFGIVVMESFSDAKAKIAEGMQ